MVFVDPGCNSDEDFLTSTTVAFWTFLASCAIMKCSRCNFRDKNFNLRLCIYELD